MAFSHSSITPDRAPSGVTLKRCPREYAATRTRLEGIATPNRSARSRSYFAMLSM